MWARGNARRSARATVRPPMPESNTPIMRRRSVVIDQGEYPYEESPLSPTSDTLPAMRSLVAAALVGAFVSLFAALARFGTDRASAQPRASAVAYACKGATEGQCCERGHLVPCPPDAQRRPAAR